MFIPHGSAPQRSQPQRHLCSVAERTFDRGPNMRIAPGSVCYPFTELKRWTMAHVLFMPARNLGHPVVVFVAVEAADHSLHVVRLPSRPRASTSDSRRRP